MWTFVTQLPAYSTENSLAMRFFEVDMKASTLIRESIQNSLDAHLSHESVKCVFTFKDIDKPVIEKYCGGPEGSLFDFFKISKEQNPKHLRTVLSHKPQVPVLFVEDFGTKGLTGPYDDLGEKYKKNGHFNGFWWQIGTSPKADNAKSNSGGSHGVGKAALTLASNLRAFWAYTIRHDDNKKLLIGYSVFPPFSNGNNHYMGYGRFGNFDQKLPLPYLSDSPIVNDFENDFGLQRYDEPGLSVVIPYPDENLTPSTIIQSVIENYSYPILGEKLEVVVRISRTDQEICINKKTIATLAKTYLQGSKTLEMMDFFGEVQALKDNGQEPLTLNNNQDLGEECFSEELTTSLREEFHKGNIIRLRVKTEVSPTDPPMKISFFEVFLKQTEDGERYPCHFIRDNIYIRDEGAHFPPSAMAMVIIDDRPLASFLRDAENPQHIKWSDAQLKELYRNAKATLQRVTGSPSTLFKLLSKEEEEEVIENFADDIFSLPEPQAKKQPGKRTVHDKVGDIKEREKPLYSMQRLSGGLKVVPPEEMDEWEPFSAKARFAYDTERGNPFRKHSPFDFDLSGLVVAQDGVQGDSSFLLKTRNISILSQTPNSITFTALDKDFELSLLGFDTKRDLMVNIRKDDGEAA